MEKESSAIKAHTHEHSHEHTKDVLNRLARASGHLNKVRSMVENGEDCSEVLIQLAAVKAALNNTGKVILKDHIEHCIVHAVEEVCVWAKKGRLQIFLMRTVREPAKP